MTQISTRVAAGQTVRVALPSCRSGLGIGTQVLTTDGSLPVEYLTPGDGIITLDAGIRKLTNVMVKTVPLSAVVRLRPSVLNEDGEGRDVVLAARQRLLVRDWRAPILFGKKAALVEAKDLADGAYITRLSGTAPMRMFQLQFDDGVHVVKLAQNLNVASAKAIQVAK